MAERKNTRELLDEALLLIQQDLQHIKEQSSQGKLDGYASQDLVRYANLLLGAIEQEEEDATKKKKAYAGMSTEELVAEWLKSKEPKDGRPPGS